RWDASDGPPVAGVSSFGWGGTNAHAVLQGWPVAAATPAAARRRDLALLLSAASPISLRRRAGDVAVLLEADPGSLEGVAATLARGRAHLNCRLALAGESAAT